MTPVSVKVGGAWKSAASVHTKVSGAWKTASDMPVKIGGVWKTGILASSSFESIATFTNPGSGTVTFSSIPQTYKHLQIRFNAFSAQSYEPRLRINGATSGYAYHKLEGQYDGTTNNVYVSGNTSTSLINIADTIGLDANYPTVGIIDINDYTNSSKNPVIRYLTGSNTNTYSYSWIQMGSGLYPTAGAVTELTLYLAGNTFTTGSTIALYGIKG